MQNRTVQKKKKKGKKGEALISIFWKSDRIPIHRPEKRERNNDLECTPACSYFQEAERSET
jgi:hypothetical protein